MGESVGLSDIQIKNSINSLNSTGVIINIYNDIGRGDPFL